MSLNIENNIFANLVTKYTSWSELKLYLESEDGGQFRILDSDDNDLCIIRYEKGTTNMNLPHSKWFRSVIWNKHSNRPVSIAPPKTTSVEFTFKTFNEVKEAGLVCQELLDGFMINCFKMIGDDTLYITSRSKLDAAGKFYSCKSFRQLFIEAFMDTLNLDIKTEAAIQECTYMRSPEVSKNEFAVFYSFLVQHKEHRIVTKINSNRVYLIHTGTVFNDGRIKIEDSPIGLFEDRMLIKNMAITSGLLSGSWAEVLMGSAEKGSEVEDSIKNILASKTWEFQGIVFKDNVGNRWRFRSEKYALVRTLRGNSPTMRERFAQLYTQNLVYKYLEYYPEDMIFMTVHLMLANTIINILYNAYVDLHITKKTNVSLIDKMYLPHLYNLHGIYLSQLRPSGLKMTLADVQAYFIKLPWQRIVFLLRKVNDLLSSVRL